LGAFLDSFGDKLGLGDGEVNDDGPSFENSLVEFFDSLLARSVVSKLDKSKALVAFLIIGVERNLYIYDFSVRSKQFSDMFFSNVKDDVSDDKSISLAKLFLLFGFALLFDYLWFMLLLFFERLWLFDLNSWLFRYRFVRLELFGHQQ
jgi:hypothetical protein